MGKRGRIRAVVAIGSVAAGIVTALAVSGARNQMRDLASSRPAASPGPTYSQLAARSARLLETTFYNGHGLWRMCDPAFCNVKNRDWGADSLTNLLYFRWMISRDWAVLPVLRTLATTARTWLPGEPASSDSVMWDAVADVRLYQATGSTEALAKAEYALQWLGTARGMSTGACPNVDYQWPFGQRGPLKTIETASNYVKAALLLYSVTGTRSYLTTAQAQYAQVRRYFLAKSGLYSAYMFDTGRSCPVLPGQYLASVNGNMIWDGQALASATGKPRYLRQAVATAQAVRAHLSDGAGIFADLQADNDIAGPLVEAMYALATSGHQAFAARWLLANASAAGSDVNPAGEYGRFFDGPPPASIATAWQINGGIAVTQAAAGLDPGGRPATSFWAATRFVPVTRTLYGRQLTISFTGRAIAIIGVIGAHCCSVGHATVLVDGIRTFSRIGIWQNMSSPARKQPDQVLFAWRWRSPGHHVITIRATRYDPEEGGSFFQMTGYMLAS